MNLLSTIFSTTTSQVTFPSNHHRHARLEDNQTAASSFPSSPISQNESSPTLISTQTVLKRTVSDPQHLSRVVIEYQSDDDDDTDIEYETVLDSSIRDTRNEDDNYRFLNKSPFKSTTSAHSRHLKKKNCSDWSCFLSGLIPTTGSAIVQQEVIQLSEQEMEERRVVAKLFARLPEEILQYVLYFFTRKELLTVTCLVNSTFWKLSMNKALWWHHTFSDNCYYSSPNLVDCLRKKIMYESSLRKRIQYVFGVSTGCEQKPSHLYKLRQVLDYTPEQSPCLSRPMSHSSQDVTDLFDEEITCETMNDFCNNIQPHRRPSLNCVHYFLEEKLTTVAQLTPTTVGNNTTKHILTEDTKMTQAINGLIAGQNDVATQPARYVSSLSGYLLGSSAIQRPRYESPLHIFPRYRHTMTMIPSNSATPNYMIVGGILSNRQMHAPNARQQGNHTMNALFLPSQWRFDVPKEHEVTCQYGTAINSRSDPAAIIEEEQDEEIMLPQLFGKHSAVYAPAIRSVIVFGGSYESTVTNDLYICRLTEDYFNSRFCCPSSPSLSENGPLFRWEKITGPKETSTAWPAPRTNHCAVMLNERTMIVIGGGVSNIMTPTNEVWSFDVIDRKWTNLTKLIVNPEVFTPRLGFASIITGNSIICYGGGFWVQSSPTEKYWKEYYNDLLILDMESMKWERIETQGEKPKGGTFPAFSPTLIGVNWYIIGGGMMLDVSSCIYQLNTVTWTWTRVGESFGADSSCLINFTMYNRKKMETKLLHCGGYRYEALDDAKIFSLHWKDHMDKKRKISI